jgi:hypothetical protein
MDNNVYNIDERDEERCTVQFRRDMNIVTDLSGEILSSEEADWVTIYMPGDPLNIINTVVTDEHKARFPNRWAEYQGMIGAKVGGTPIEQWDVHPNMIKVLKDLGFSTIEQVANASEHSLMRIQGGYGWKTKALKFLEDTKPKVNEEIAAMRAENAELREMVSQLLQAQSVKKAG